MKAKELREKDITALTKELTELQRAHFNLRMQKGTQQLTNTSQMRKVRKDIARAKTVINQKTKAAA